MYAYPDNPEPKPAKPLEVSPNRRAIVSLDIHYNSTCLRASIMLQFGPLTRGIVYQQLINKFIRSESFNLAIKKVVLAYLLREGQGNYNNDEDP